MQSYRFNLDREKFLNVFCKEMNCTDCIFALVCKDDIYSVDIEIKYENKCNKTEKKWDLPYDD